MLVTVASIDTNSPGQGYAVLAVGIGGACGALLRSFSAYLCVGIPFPIPLSTLLVNMCGSFLIGLSTQLFALSSSSLTFYHDLFITGFLGGLTTFSTLMLESVLLIEDGWEQRVKERKERQQKPAVAESAAAHQAREQQLLEAAKEKAEDVTLPDAPQRRTRSPMIRFSSALFQSPVFWGVFNVVVHNVLCISLVFLGLAMPTGFRTTVFAT